MKLTAAFEVERDAASLPLLQQNEEWLSTGAEGLCCFCRASRYEHFG